MKSKRLLKFYFSAESVNRALDNLITENALASAGYGRDGVYYAEKICALINAKRELSALWRYLDGVIGALSVDERAVLRFYGTLRGGTSKLSTQSRREIKRVTVKFTRRARAVGRYAEGVRLVGEYYCLMK